MGGSQCDRVYRSKLFAYRAGVRELLGPVVDVRNGLDDSHLTVESFLECTAIIDGEVNRPESAFFLNCRTASTPSSAVLTLAEWGRMW